MMNISFMQNNIKMPPESKSYQTAFVREPFGTHEKQCKRTSDLKLDRTYRHVHQRCKMIMVRTRLFLEPNERSCELYGHRSKTRLHKEDTTEEKKLISTQQISNSK